MSQREKSRNTDKSTCSQASEDSLSPSKWPTLGDLAASFRQDFHAKTSAQQVEVPDLQENKVDYGGKHAQPLAWYDQRSSSWRMCLPSLFEDSKLFSGRWPRSGIVLNGIACQLDTLAHRTKGIASGLSESGMWPTPAAHPAGWKHIQVVDKNGNPPAHANQRFYDKKTGRLVEKGLEQVIKMWPIPKSHLSGPDYARANRPRSGGDDLATSVARENPTGQLNPPFVEWLMGFPIGWTDLNA